MTRDEKCRNGHTRTAQNTYKHRNGQRQCMDCPGWRWNKSTAARRERGAPSEGRYHQPLTPERIAYLRSLVPCYGCGNTPGERGTTEHEPGCSVASNTEGPDPHGKRAVA